MAYATDELIEHLRNTANKIESGEWDYEWVEPKRCNCGLLTKSIIGEEVEIQSTWRSAVQFPENTKCNTVGLSFSDVAKSLRDVGLTPKDINELELLHNEAVLEEMGLDIDHVKDDDPDTVAKYMRTWADLLEEAQDVFEDVREIIEEDEIVDKESTVLVS